MRARRNDTAQSLIGVLLVGSLVRCGGTTTRDSEGHDVAAVGVDSGVAVGCREATDQVCPTHLGLFGEGVRLECELDLSGGMNLVEDQRLEFADGPNHVIRFIAPVDATYAVWVEHDQETERTCYASTRAANGELHSSALCSPPFPVEVDGLVSLQTDQLPLGAGDSVLIIVGCASFGLRQDGPYTLVVERQ